MQIESIEEWIGRDVVDRHDAKVGKLADIYFDAERPVIGEVRSGRLAKRLHLVPLLDATIARDHLRVPYEASLIEAGPSASDGELTAAELQGVEANYQLRLAPGLLEQLESSGIRRERLARTAELHAELERLEEASIACEARVREADAAVADAQRQADDAHRAHDRARSELAEAREQLRTA